MSTAPVVIEGLEPLRQSVSRWPEQVALAVGQEIVAEVTPLMDHMRDQAMAIGGSARIAARTLRLATTQAGMSVVAGRGADLGSIVLAGSEYGGRKRPKRAYIGRSPKGKPYVMRRRATRQFNPHLGSRGYWFWPTARTDLRGINKRVGEIIRKAVSE